MTMQPPLKPVAVCGVALRLPGGINNTEDLWNAIRNGKDMRGLVPDNRYSKEGFSDARGSKGAIKTRYGYFLDQDPAHFDSSLFSLTKEEARRTDPQQRLLIEVVKECFENAGVTNYRGRAIGCYLGTFGEDWLQSQSKEDQHSGGYVMGGQSDMMLANRVSYENDLRGPSMVIKTGCSASLVALHEACRGIQMNDCDGALVAGTNLILGPSMTAAMTSEGILSPEGSCKTFDSKADGFARGEAITAIYLQSLDRALEERLPMRGIIANSGINCDGRSRSILQPSMEAQAALMRKVYADAGLDVSRTAFVECHGTGTPTGDPIETAAVGQVFGGSGVYIGSIKPNVGHSEGASGLSSVLKGILMLEKGMIAPNIKFQTPNPNLDFRDNRLQVPTQSLTWPRDRDLRVSVNSFGIGGSNAHVILEHPYKYRFADRKPYTVRIGSPQLLLMSASASSVLKKRVDSYSKYCDEHTEALSDLSYTLACRREHYRWRTFAICSENEQFQTAPSAKTPMKAGGVTMVFSGQGAQWAQMGLELLSDNPDFSRAINSMDQILKGLKCPPDWSIETELKIPSDTSRVDQAEISQPLCTAIQLALLEVYFAAGIRPNAVVGHSSGEIAAAYATGAISMEEAIIIAYYRGFVCKNSGAKGGMAVVGLDSETSRSLLRPGVGIACENSPSSTTISGDKDVLLLVLEEVKERHRGVLARELKVDVAYHSHHMQDPSEQYSRLLEDEFASRQVCRESMTLPMYSSLRNEKIISPAKFSIEYWVENLLSPVRFQTALTNLVREQEGHLILEVGPHSALAGPIRQVCSSVGANCNYCTTLTRGSHSTKSLLTTFGTLYQRGIPVKWEKLTPQGEVLTDVPTYPWKHSTPYWYESRLSRAWRKRSTGHHELLGLRVPQSTDLDPIWRVMLNIEDVPWLADHKVKGDIVFPFAAYVSMAGEALSQMIGSEGGYTIQHLSVATAMVLDREKPLEIVTTLHSRNPKTIDAVEASFDFSVASTTGSAWIRHCSGIVGAPKEIEPSTIKEVQFPRQVGVSSWYSGLSRFGLDYGPAFRRIDKLATSTDHPFAHARLSNALKPESSPYPLHPASIDASFQVGLAASVNGLCRNFSGAEVPTFVEELQVAKTATDIVCTVACVNGEISIDGAQTNRKPCMRLRGMRLTQLPDDDLAFGEDKYGAARLGWVPHYDFQDISNLINVPNFSDRDKQMVEELALLCIVESFELLRDLKPSHPHLLKYREWLGRIAQEAFANRHPVLSNVSSLVSCRIEERHQKIEKIRKDSSASPLIAAFTKGISRVYDNIQGLFTGEMDTLELLLHENNLAQIYDAVSFDYGNFISSLCDTVPNLRILEIGAGTGGTTEYILRGLDSHSQNPPYANYTFSDVSAGFFPKARQRFADALNMEFKVLDVSEDPLKQGFEPESYDLILAANVVHATPCLAQTLSNLQPLLSARGQLVLTEFCTHFRAPNYIYGNFSGWWLGEADDRKWEPYVNTARWNKELRAAGFSESVSTVLDSAEPWQYCATLVAQKAKKENSVTKAVTLLGADIDAGCNRSIVQGLKDEGLTAQFVKLSDYSEIEGDVIVSLDLETNFFEHISQQDFAHFQQLCPLLAARNVLWLMPPTQVNCPDPRGSQRLGAIRTARSECNLPLTTLEIDHLHPKFKKSVVDVFQKVREWDDSANASLAPDRELAVHDDVVMVGRYQPFTLELDLEQSIVSPKMRSPLPDDLKSWATCSCKGEPLTNNGVTGSFARTNVVACHDLSMCNGTATPKPAVGNGPTGPNCSFGHRQADERPVSFTPSPQHGVSAILNQHATYLITGGLGGLGKAISVWLAEKGARSLLFLSPSAGLKPSHHQIFTELESMGCHSVAVPGSVQIEADVHNAIHAAKSPIKGVLHLAMQLRDASISDMTYDDWNAVISPKVDGTWNLHRSLGDSLDFLVMASSLSTVLDQPGQGNYNAANTFMESFCQYRHNLGLPASILNICPIEGIGYVADNADARRKLKSQGHWFLDEGALLKFLELAILNSSNPPVMPTREGGSRVIRWENHSQIVMGLRSDLPLDDRSNRASWRRDRRMGSYHNITPPTQTASQGTTDGSGGKDLKRFLAQAENQPHTLTAESTKKYLAEEIGKKIFAFIMRPEEEMDVSLTLLQVGLDSLMAIEVRRWWKQVFACDISVLEILNSGTIAELGGLAAEGLGKRFSKP